MGKVARVSLSMALRLDLELDVDLDSKIEQRLIVTRMERLSIMDETWWLSSDNHLVSSMFWYGFSFHSVTIFVRSLDRISLYQIAYRRSDQVEDGVRASDQNHHILLCRGGGRLAARSNRPSDVVLQIRSKSSCQASNLKKHSGDISPLLLTLSRL